MNTVNDGSTEKMTVNQKLELLRTKMKERGMDAYMVPTADFHESEYVGDHFKCRQFLTRFYRFCGNCSSDHEGSMPVGRWKIFCPGGSTASGNFCKDDENGTGRRAFCSRISGSRSAGKWLSGL